VPIQHWQSYFVVNGLPSRSRTTTSPRFSSRTPGPILDGSPTSNSFAPAGAAYFRAAFTESSVAFSNSFGSRCNRQPGLHYYCRRSGHRCYNRLPRIVFRASEASGWHRLVAPWVAQVAIFLRRLVDNLFQLTAALPDSNPGVTSQPV
jgi:hypothetical protein